jgi:hypothetical protein
VRRIHLLTLAALLLGGSRNQATDLRESTITVHVHRKGLFFSKGTDYTMVAPIASSLFDLEQPSVDIVVHAKDVAVIDPAVPQHAKEEIESAMRGPRALDSATFPEIHFTAAQVAQTAPDQYRVTGTLQLHGVVQQLSFDFDGNAGHYHGRVTLHPSDFGIPPLSFAGGLVRMTDEIDVEFDLFGDQPAPPPPSLPSLPSGDSNPQ